MLTALKHSSYLLLSLMVTLSCSKDNNPAEKEGTPVSKQEIERGIIGKWDINGITQLTSIEFTADGLYAIEGDLSNVPGLDAVTTSTHRRIEKIQGIFANTSRVQPLNSYVGEYTIAANGDVLLDGVMTLKVTKLTNGVFEFELSIPDTLPLTGSANIKETSDVTDKTRLLSKKWVFTGTNSMFKDFSLRFTTFGTLFVQMTTFSENVAIGPNGQIISVEHSEELVNFRVDWDWKQGTNDNIVELFMLDTETGEFHLAEWPIRKLTDNALEIRVDFDEEPFWLPLRAMD